MLRSYSGQLSQVQGQALPRPLPFALKDGVTQELQRLQREGILVPVKTSEWATPIVPGLKRDGSVRICGDFKVTINPVATVEKYPLPQIENLWSALCRGQKFTKLDLRDAYQQLVLQDASRKYVTISTTLGLFQYARLPFGMASAPAIFQWEMDNLFRGMRHVAVYLNDILVTGTDDGDHLQNLHNVLARLQDAGLKLKLEKCVFMAPSLEYLGRVISQAGLSPAPRKVDAVLKAPNPHNKKELQSYLGLINFYRSFLPNLSAHLQPLHLLLRDGQQWTWKQEQEVAFQRKQRYSQLDKEDLALMFGVERFHLHLWGRKFEAITDHKPLLSLLGPDKAVPVQVPAAAPEPAELFMLEHASPEVLSRSAVSLATSCDPVLSQVVKAVSRGEELVQQAYSHKASELSLHQGCLYSSATIAALRQVFAAQGLPDVIGSDNGPAFASTEYLAWLTKNGIRQMMVPPYHPASNGCPRALFQYRTTPHDVTGHAPCEFLLGRMVKTPLDVLHPDLHATALLKKLKQKLAADRGCRPGPLPESGAPVFTRNFRPGPVWSAGQMLSTPSASSLLVRMPDGNRHANHVRPRLVTQPATLGATSEGQPEGGPTATPVAASEAPEALEPVELGDRGTPQGSVISATLLNLAMIGLSRQLT
ncbi:uncharacterized protein LOC119456791 [Dermacentor silvarum]|uniref:uncharacterized protein LOC119456791 n=1 Tax=Dermacentor silvarum TaxID=543639 RepID=UPI00189BC45C|nr:uncharacterized protein LOC119456791 [Dermacentor silvarum]